jgi:hypothetical protein
MVAIENGFAMTQTWRSKGRGRCCPSYSVGPACAFFSTAAVTRSTQVTSKIAAGDGGVGMKTAAEYRAMAEECIKWASEAYTDEVRESYLQLARIWLDTASRMNGLAPTDPETGPSSKAAQSTG